MCQWRRSGVFTVKFVHISHLVVGSVSIVNFEQVNADGVFWETVSSKTFDRGLNTPLSSDLLVF